MTRLAAVLLAATLTLSGWACAPDEHVEVVPPSEPPARGTAEPVRAPESPGSPPPTPVPAGTAAPSDPSNIERYILDIFGPAGPKALCIAALESTGQRGHYNPKARGRAGEISLFQIRPHLHSWRLAEVGGTSLWNWKDNVRVAHHLYTSRGWRPWTVRNRC